MIGAFLSRAASNAATTVEEEVTFWPASESVIRDRIGTYDGRHGEVLLLTVLEERCACVNDFLDLDATWYVGRLTHYIVANDDTFFAGQNVFDTHVCDIRCVEISD